MTSGLGTTKVDLFTWDSAVLVSPVKMVKQPVQLMFLYVSYLSKNVHHNMHIAYIYMDIYIVYYVQILMYQKLSSFWDCSDNYDLANQAVDFKSSSIRAISNHSYGYLWYNNVTIMRNRPVQSGRAPSRKTSQSAVPLEISQLPPARWGMDGCVLLATFQLTHNEWGKLL